MTTVLLANPFAEELSNLPKRDYQRVAQAIERLAEDPVSGSHLLRGTKDGANLYVIRVGNYRMIYSVNSVTNTVTLTTIFKRAAGYTDAHLGGGVTDKKGD